MVITLDDIEFYQGPPCQKPRSEFSTRKKHSSIVHVTQPVHRALPVGPVLTPDSSALTLPSNRPEPHALPHGQFSTSRAESHNVFDVELDKLRNGAEGSQSDNAVAEEGDNNCFPNGELGDDNLGGLKSGFPDSGTLKGSPKAI